MVLHHHLLTSACRITQGVCFCSGEECSKVSSTYLRFYSWFYQDCFQITEHISDVSVFTFHVPDQHDTDKSTINWCKPDLSTVRSISSTDMTSVYLLSKYSFLFPVCPSMGVGLVMIHALLVVWLCKYTEQWGLRITSRFALVGGFEVKLTSQAWFISIHL